MNEQSSKNTQPFNLEPAKKFFTEAIKLTQAFSSKSTPSVSMDPVQVDKGACVKMTLWDEYKGVKLQKFFAEQGTTFVLPHEGLCRGFIVQEGGMLVKYSGGDMQLPQDRHFFYMRDSEDIVLTFTDDTWFYIVSMQP